MAVSDFFVYEKKNNIRLTVPILKFLFFPTSEFFFFSLILDLFAIILKK